MKEENLPQDITEIQRIIQEYYKKLEITNVNNSEEMGNFLVIYDLPRWNHEELENLRRPINSNEIETIIKNLPKSRSSRPDFLLVNSTKYSKKI